MDRGENNKRNKFDLIPSFASDQLPSLPESYFSIPAVKQSDTIIPPLCTTHLDPTTDCSFNCLTCIESHQRGTRTYLSLPVILRVLKDIHDIGCKDIRLYGGEPTLHNKLPEIISIAVSMGFSLRLVTNGSMLHNESLVKSIISSDRVCVRVSINAHSPKTHAKHHGCSERLFGEIQNNVLQLIKRKGRVSISYLLSPESIRELPEACRFWRQAGAETLTLRIMTGPHGHRPLFDWRDDFHELILRTLDKYRTWISLPSGLEDWIISGKLQKQERYEKCYMGYFRLIISPLIFSSGHSVLADNTRLNKVETDRMWISACPYHRYDRSSGCAYPKSLPDWWRNHRNAWLDSVWGNRLMCQDTICSRFNLNKKIFQAIHYPSCKPVQHGN